MTGRFASLTARSDWILVTDVVGRDLQDLQPLSLDCVGRDGDGDRTSLL